MVARLVRQLLIVKQAYHASYHPGSLAGAASTTHLRTSCAQFATTTPIATRLVAIPASSHRAVLLVNAGTATPADEVHALPIATVKSLAFASTSRYSMVTYQDAKEDWQMAAASAPMIINVKVVTRVSMPMSGKDYQVSVDRLQVDTVPQTQLVRMDTIATLTTTLATGTRSHLDTVSHARMEFVPRSRQQMHQLVLQLVHQQIYQQIHQQVNQQMHRLVHQQIHQQIHQQVNQQVNQLVHQQMHQQVHQLVHQQIFLPTRQETRTNAVRSRLSWLF